MLNICLASSYTGAFLELQRTRWREFADFKQLPNKVSQLLNSPWVFVTKEALVLLRTRERQFAGSEPLPIKVTPKPNYPWVVCTKKAPWVVCTKKALIIRH